MNKSQRNNNPLNLRYAKQREALGADGTGFATFPSPDAGWRAGHNQIELDQGRRLTLKEFIFKFAPPNENDTNAYLDFVATQLRVEVDIPIAHISKYALAGVMAKFEGYYNK